MYWPDLSDMKRRRVATVKQIKTVDAVRVMAVVMVLTWGCNLRGLRVKIREQRSCNVDTPTSCQIIGYGYIERPWCFDFRGYQLLCSSCDLISRNLDITNPFLHTRTNADVLVTCDFLFLNATVCLYLKGWYGSWCGRGRRWNDTLLTVSTFDAAQLANALSHRVLIRAYVRARCELHAVVANTRTAIRTKKKWSNSDGLDWTQ